MLNMKSTSYMDQMTWQVKAGFFPEKLIKQNREITEGYSKSIVRDYSDKFGKKKNWLQHVEHMQVPKVRDQLSGGVSVPCRHVTPVANVIWKPLKIQ